MRIFLMVVLSYLALVLQTTVGPSLRIAGAGADLLALEAHAVVLLSNSPYSFLWAGWIGLVHDLSSAGTLGPGMFWFTLSGFLLGKLRQQVYTHHPLVQSLLILLGVGLSLSLLTATRLLLGETGVAWRELYKAVGGGALYTAVVALPLLTIAGRWHKPEPGWT